MSSHQYVERLVNLLDPNANQILNMTVDQALAAGLITQAQADALKERSAASGRFGGRELHGFLGFGSDTTIDPDALLADALGITTDELQAARVEAQDLALTAAVEEGQITQEQADQMKAEQALKTYLSDQGLQTQMQTLYQDAVKQAVKAGVITQAQADAILANQGKFGGMRGFDGFGGRGGMHGHGGMRGLDAPDTTAPSNTTPSRLFQGGATSGSNL